ncbi:hypothetical protein M8C13_05155 [Crossiella sp. SN42]|uniref:hypothetical protein n=1 Tax=Crossiella sp. SN42 TaxID=2944808 RepID=UPI00207D64FB|nr:hypothetical protein [Crossiella sp. SN42]MCO1575146.1 hypothetical protein [Crossiella sp. SN42]
MPPELDETGLVVSAATSDGSEHHRFDLGRFPGDIRLRQEIAGVLARLCNEGGSWRSIWTIRSHTALVGNFLHWLDRQDIRPGTVAELRRSHWDAWVLHCAPTKTGGGGGKVSKTGRCC